MLFESMLKRKVNFNKNEMESKMENSPYAFREARILLQLI